MLGDGGFRSLCTKEKQPGRSQTCDSRIKSAWAPVWCSEAASSCMATALAHGSENNKPRHGLCRFQSASASTWTQQVASTTPAIARITRNRCLASACQEPQTAVAETVACCRKTGTVSQFQPHSVGQGTPTLPNMAQPCSKIWECDTAADVSCKASVQESYGHTSEAAEAVRAKAICQRSTVRAGSKRQG